MMTNTTIKSWKELTTLGLEDGEKEKTAMRENGEMRDNKRERETDINNEDGDLPVILLFLFESVVLKSNGAD
jgi:hypothetical protein